MSDQKTEATAGSGYAGPAGSAPRYEIERVSDFLKVPQDRIADCLAEFKEFLGLAHEMQDVTKAVGEVVGADGSCEIGPFTWIDDGKKTRSVTIQTVIEKQNMKAEAPK